MAKQKGIIPLVGTIGGINFYYLNGKPIARMAGGGFNAKAIKTKESMQRVRENGSEFGHCSRVNKVFRRALLPFYDNHKFTFFHSRLMTLFTGLKVLDAVNTRGQRRVAKGLDAVEGKRALMNFNYTPDCQPQLVLPFSYSMDWPTTTFSIPRFDIQPVRFISGATHIAIQFGVLDFNFETFAYQLHLASRLVLAKNDINTSLSLTPTSLPTGLGVQLAVLGIRYYQEIDGVMYLLNAQDGVGIGVVGIGD